jgi:hypothetical protein
MWCVLGYDVQNYLIRTPQLAESNFNDLLGPGCSIPRSAGSNDFQICTLIALDLCDASWSCEVIEGISTPPSAPPARDVTLLLAFRNHLQCMKALYTIFILFVRLPIRKAMGWDLMLRSWRRRPCGRWIEEDGTRYFPHIPCSDKSGPVHKNGAIGNLRLFQ